MEENKEVIVEETKEVQKNVVKTISKEKLAEEMNLVLPKNFTDVVLNTINDSTASGQLVLPEDYVVGNALKSAYLALQSIKDKNYKPAMEVCTQKSVANALLDMVTMGLNPAKKQCYFIIRGSELTMMPSYFGNQMALKRLPSIKDVYANVIYDGDTIEIENANGRDVLKNHGTSFANRDNPIVGAYAVVEKVDGEKIYTFMTKKEIDACWNKSSSKAHDVHNEFPAEMAKRTVINRACKNYVNTSTDCDMLVQAINRTIENEYKEEEPKKEEKVIMDI